MSSRLFPIPVTIKHRYPLTKSGSTKKTYHLILDISSHPIAFNPGDSLGIYPQNDPLLVEELIQSLRASKEDKIFDPRSKQMLTLEQFFLAKANLVRLTASLMRLVLDHEPRQEKKEDLAALLSDQPKLITYLEHHTPSSFLKQYAHLCLPLQEVCEQFSPLLPRFYSAASSLKAHPDEVHLTVALLHYEHGGERRTGVASHFLCHLAELEKTPVPIFVQPALHFSLPQDPLTPIIMIGPGTGIAPFRAFMQERRNREAGGKNWLFFGERNRTFDFFYEEFWHLLIAEGRLRLDLAFSRDQSHKHYVQHAMEKNASELWQWLQEGAVVYICGDKEKMAKGVEAMLHKIAQQEGRMSEEQAREYFRQLKKSKRYQLDVY